MGPRDYKAKLDANELKKYEQFPVTVMKKWWEQCDQDNFSDRVTYGPTDNEGLNTLSANYAWIHQMSGRKTSSRDPPSESVAVVEETRMEEVTLAIHELALTVLPRNLKNYQGTG